MTQAHLNGDTELRMIASEQGGYVSRDAASVAVNGPGCVAALDTIATLVDAALVGAATGDEKIQSNVNGTVATQVFGARYEGTVCSPSPEDQAGRRGGSLTPSVAEGGARAANHGGPALAIPASSAIPPWPSPSCTTRRAPTRAR